jgi:hypothetical protein
MFKKKSNPEQKWNILRWVNFHSIEEKKTNLTLINIYPVKPAM